VSWEHCPVCKSRLHYDNHWEVLVNGKLVTLCRLCWRLAKKGRIDFKKLEKR
jgi:hypothetical protein